MEVIFMEMYELTPQQRGIVDSILIYGKNIFTISGAVIYKKLYSYETINKALNIFVKNNDGFRVRLTKDKGVTKQYIEHFNYENFAEYNFENYEQFEKFAEEESRRAFKIYGESLYRFYICTIENISCILAVVSHIIADGVTYGILCQEVTKACEDPLYNSQIFSFEDYLKTNRAFEYSPEYSANREYWESEMDFDLIECNIKAPLKYEGVKSARMDFNPPYNKIKNICKKLNISEAVLFETAFAIYLKKINENCHNIVIGTPVLNRKNYIQRNTAGLFQSALPLHINTENIKTVLELISVIKKQHKNMFRHMSYSCEDISLYLKEKKNYKGSVYSVLVSFQNKVVGDGSFKTRWFGCGYDREPLSFHIDCRDGSENYDIHIDYHTELFEKKEIELLYNRIMYIVNQLSEVIEIEKIKILPDSEKNTIENIFNNTFVEYNENMCIHTAFEKKAEKIQEHTALVYKDKSYTYSEVNKMSYALGAYLREKGIGRNKTVAIITEKNIYTPIAMLAVLKAGGAFVLIDFDTPKKRIEYILNECKCSIVISDSNMNFDSREVIVTEDFDFTYTEKIENINTENDLCYIIYTSGSTGFPKGINISHKGVVNLSCNVKHNETISEIEKYRKIISVTNVSFDIFVFESITALLRGMTVYIVNNSDSLNSEYVADLISENNIEVLQTTPSKLRMYISNMENAQKLRELKVIILIGEVFSKSLYNEIRSISHCKLYNNYGPAETTVWSANSFVTGEKITIGKPIANTRIYIKNNENQILPIGVQGEICIGGYGVGKGYVNNAPENEKHFCKGENGGIIYKTGDLGCYNTNGEIIYLGRKDGIFKIRGRRIEPAEIENVASTVEGVNISAVVFGTDKNSRQYIACFYTGTATEKMVKEEIALKLPRYMMPNYFINIDNMPITKSGKIDRKKLLSLEISKNKNTPEPETPTEKILCEILGKVLKIQKPNVEEDFFEMGGDSLSALEIVALAEKQGIHIPYTLLFESHSIRNVCRKLQ